MLLWLLDRLALRFPELLGPQHLAAFDKITLRSTLAALAAFLFALLVGPRVIAALGCRWLDPNKSDSPELRQLHAGKGSTPTMGGLFVVGGILLAVALFGDLSNVFIIQSLVITAGLAVVGACDDLVKLRSTRNGLRARPKLLLQLAVCGSVAVLAYLHHRGLPGGLLLHLPLSHWAVGLGVGFIPLAIVVLVGASNAVNLTDGLDGLAGGCLIFATAAMTLVTYASGHAEMAQYLKIARVPGAGEMTIVGGAMIGATLGFLWFNCHPAQVFMGDTGSLPLGGLLGLMAVVTRQELLLVAVGGVFVAEALSVIVQVGSFKLRGRRVFRCAPLHHHFQFQGWPESRIVVRFWIASALCALLGLAALKIDLGPSSSAGPSAPLTAARQALHR